MILYVPLIPTCEPLLNFFLDPPLVLANFFNKISVLAHQHAPCHDTYRVTVRQKKTNI